MGSDGRLQLLLLPGQSADVLQERSGLESQNPVGVGLPLPQEALTSQLAGPPMSCWYLKYESLCHQMLGESVATVPMLQAAVPIGLPAAVLSCSQRITVAGRLLWVLMVTPVAFLRVN